MEQGVPSASSQQTQNCEEWLVHQRVVLRGFTQWGTQEYHEIQHGEVQNPAAGKEQTTTGNQKAALQKRHESPGRHQGEISQQCTLVTKEMSGAWAVLGKILPAS